MLKVYNTMSRSLEEFKPIHGNRVNMFVCGPTVYDLSHLGHARTYVAFDIIARYLRFKGYSLFYLMNITDVDDKILKRAREKGIDPLKLARDFEEKFYEDMEALDIKSVNLYARASEHIPEMVKQIETLLEKGYAYQVDGDIYYDISKFPEYGRLSRQRPEELVKHRVKVEPEKRNPQDFALWKKRKPGEAISWKAPWGEGRPGWHIEDTAITTTYLGNRYDVHGGAIELAFPHHEAEIAQAEMATGEKPLVKYWLHTGVLNVGGQKMSKSLGNFVTIREALSKYDREVLRLFFASTHYRSPIDYGEESLKMAEESLERLYNTLEAVERMEEGEEEREEAMEKVLEESEKTFLEAMDDDFNTPMALAALFNLSREVNRFLEGRDRVSRGLKERIVTTFRRLGGILGILQRREERLDLAEDLISLLIEIRDTLRRDKNWKLSDTIRDRLKDIGIILEDTPQGTRWRLKIGH